MKFTTTCVSLLLGCYALNTTASPIDSDNLISILQLGNSYNYSQYSTDSYFQHAYASGLEAYGDATTGKVGSASSTNANSIINIFDTLTFNASAEIGFSFVLDGTLASNSIFDNPFGQGRIDIYDITGFDNWLEMGDLFGTPLVEVSSAVSAVSNNTVQIGMDGVFGFQDGASFSTSELLSRDGSLHDVSYELSGSFMADAAKTYGIRLLANTRGGGGGAADFLNTGTFAFTDLGGATYTSGSGAFLSAVPANEVPNPSSAWLFIMGLAALVSKVRLKS